MEIGTAGPELGITVDLPFSRARFVVWCGGVVCGMDAGGLQDTTVACGVNVLCMCSMDWTGLWLTRVGCAAENKRSLVDGEWLPPCRWYAWSNGGTALICPLSY